MHLVLLPTDIEGNNSLDLVSFVEWLELEHCTEAANWARILEGKSAWREGMQEAFEVLVNDYWAASGIEEGFWPSGAQLEAHLEKMRATLEPKIASTRDIQSRNAAKRVLDSSVLNCTVQKQRVSVCREQLEQSERKLELLEAKLKAAQDRWQEFAGFQDNSVDSF